MTLFTLLKSCFLFTYLYILIGAGIVSLCNYSEISCPCGKRSELGADHTTYMLFFSICRMRGALLPLRVMS
jgi:hypothetical protein